MDRRLREELEDIARRDRAILDSVGDGLYGLDSEGRITFVNPAAAEHLGYETEELLGTRSHSTFHARRPDGSLYPEKDCPAERALTEGLASRGIEEVFWRKDGSALRVEYTATPIRERGRITGAVIAFRDIGARKAVEEALRESERSLKASQRLAHLGNWELDLVRNVLRWSDEMFRIFEIEPSRFGATYEAFLAAVHPEDREVIERTYTDSVRTREPYDVVHRLRMADGRVKFVREQCETFYDGDGKPLRSTGTTQDVTERRRVETELLAASRYARSLIEASLDPKVVQPQVLDLNDIVLGMERMLHRVIGEDVELVAVREPALRRVRIDPGQMEQVIMNLAVNARDAMPQGGRLTIETQRARGPRGVRRRDAAHGRSRARRAAPLDESRRARALHVRVHGAGRHLPAHARIVLPPEALHGRHAGASGPRAARRSAGPRKRASLAPEASCRSRRRARQSHEGRRSSRRSPRQRASHHGVARRPSPRRRDGVSARPAHLEPRLRVPHPGA
jgi:PAS domain S-box-containing protein